MSTSQGADLLRNTAGVKVLPQLRALRVGGDDAFTWLQGQVTNDVLSLRPGEATYALLLDAQGKVQTDLHVLRRAEDAVLLLPQGGFEATVARLDRFVVMEDVELEPMPDVRVVTVQGPLASAITGGVENAFPVDRLGSGGVDVLVPAGELERVENDLVVRARAQGGDRVDDASFSLARIRAGRAALGSDFGENTLPQEAGLGGIAVSFTKGCYVGQEPVIMLEHRGKPPKRLVRFEAPATLVGRAPLEIRAGGEAAGTLTSIAADPATTLGAVALGLVKRARFERGETFTADGAELRVLGLAGSLGARE